MVEDSTPSLAVHGLQDSLSHKPVTANVLGRVVVSNERPISETRDSPITPFARRWGVSSTNIKLFTELREDDRG